MVNNTCFLIREAWNRSRSYLMVVIIKNVMEAAIPLINIGGIGIVVKSILEMEGYNAALRKILFFVGLNLLIAVINNVLSVVENNAMRKSTNVLQFGYMEDCVNIDYHFVQDKTLLNLKPKSMGARPEFFLNLWGKCINGFAEIAGVVALIAITSPVFIFLIVILSLMIIEMNIFMDKKEFHYNQEKVEDDRKLDYLYDVMTNYKYAKEIRMNKAVQLIESKYDTVLKKQLQTLKMLIREKIGVECLSNAVTLIQLFTVYAYFTYQVYAGNIDLAEYTIMVSSVTLFATALVSLFTNVGKATTNFKAIDFLKEYEQVVKENSTNRASNELQYPDVDLATGIIRFDNVSFKYPGADRNTLSNICLDIQPGKKTALVGLNGAGKSTLIMLLLRLYQPTEGTIYINDVDISTIPFKQYIAQFSVVLQDFALFAYSLKENIVFNEEYDEEKIEKCLERSGLFERVGTLPEGMETSLFKELDTNGVELSGGEGQKVALARALYKNGSIVIMDEPTSAFDPLAEYDFFKRLEELSEGKTTLFVSHRLSSTVFCDDIVVLKDGCIVEEGTHDTLMANNSTYRELFDLQAKYYEKGTFDE